jgi:CDP-diacylglycerol--glycerol-3-phosphate 3-phosphatidyltransferase
MNLPNLLSVSRVFLIIPIIIFFEYHLYSLSILTFTFAAITDYLDGYFARKNNLGSDLGALLDLLADKIFVSILLIWMTFTFRDSSILISSILIISREISISYLRLFIISKSKDIKEVSADFLGKFKTAIQMVGLGFILISPLTPDLIFNIGLFLLLSSAAISWYSFIRYLNKWNV